MNPPYNAQKKHAKKVIVKIKANNTKSDPSKGFHFVYHVASKIKAGKLAVLLPLLLAQLVHLMKLKNLKI